MSRRRRVRASDIASPNPRKGLVAMALIGVALVLVLMFKGGFGDSTAGFMQNLTNDPDLELPPSATERAAGGVVPVGAQPGAPIGRAPSTVSVPPSGAPLTAGSTALPSVAPLTAASVNAPAAAVSAAPASATPGSVAPAP